MNLGGNMEGKNIIIGYDLSSYPIIIEINNLEGTKYCTSWVMHNYLESIAIPSDLLYVSPELELYYASGPCETNKEDNIYVLKNLSEEEKRLIQEKGE